MSSIVTKSEKHTIHSVIVESGASICGEDWGPKLLFSTILFSFVYPPSPSPPLRLEVGPIKCSQGSEGALYAPPADGVWSGATAEIEFCTFLPKNLTASVNNSNDFCDNQLQDSLDNKGIP